MNDNDEAHGWLLKKSPHGFSWPKRWFSIDCGDDYMSWTEEETSNSDDIQVLGTIRLQTISAVTEPVVLKDKCIFQITSADGPRTFILAVDCSENVSQGKRDALLWVDLISRRTMCERLPAPAKPDRIPRSDAKRHLMPSLVEGAKRQVDRLKEKASEKAPESIKKTPLLKHRGRRDSISSPNAVFLDGAARQDIQILSVAKTNGANVNHQKSTGESALFLAIDDAEVIRWLLENGCELSMIDFKGMTPLMIAIRERHLETVKVMLEFAVDPDDFEFFDQMGRNVHFYARKHDREFVNEEKLVPLLPKEEPEHILYSKYMKSLDWWLSFYDASDPEVEPAINNLDAEVKADWKRDWPPKNHPLRRKLFQVLRYRHQGKVHDLELEVLQMQRDVLYEWAEEIFEKHPEFRKNVDVDEILVEIGVLEGEVAAE